MIEALYTIGYERADLNNFIDTLKNADVDILLDVRAAPHSRRPGFSKRELARALEEAGMGYHHEGELGVPKPLRDKVRSDGDYDDFFDQYARLLEGREQLMRDLAHSLDGSVALMCYERDHHICHRWMAADRLAFLTGLEPKHLQPEIPDREQE
jgi:uncharacterized protein (DUF488 family)